jgi:hypothetical protein
MPAEPKKGELNDDFGFYVERPFHIISQMPGRRYIDVIDNKNIVIKTTNSYDSQVWWFDQVTKTIRNQKFKNVSMHVQNNGRGRKMELYNTNSGWFQLFKYSGQNIMNVQDGKVLDVQSNRDKEGQQVIVWRRHNGLNQRWKILYLDQKEKEPTTGLDEDSGLHRNRPFYIQSRLPAKRVVTIGGHRNLFITKMKRDNPAQLFYFDHLTRTIKSQQYKAKSIDIQSSGRGQNLHIWSTNARWW